MKVTGVILAGGKSSRMGTDKSFVTYKGKKLIQYAIETLTPICDEVLISSNNNKYSEFGLPVIEDVYKDKGPLAGLHAACKFASNERILVLPCDNPEVTIAVFQKLIEYSSLYDAVIPVHALGKEPLIACYKKSIYSNIEKSIEKNQLKLYSFLETITVKAVSFDALSLFKNINSQTDLL